MPERLPSERDVVELVVRLDRKLKYKGAAVSIYRDTVITNGNEARWDFIHHDGAAAVVPVTEDGKILMVHQYRNALDRETLEISASKADDPKEPRIECTYRELEGETGSRTEELEPLIRINTTVAFRGEGVDIFVTKNLIPSHQNLDDDKEIKMKAWELSDLLEMTYSRETTDAKTVAATTAHAVKYGKQDAIIQRHTNEVPGSRHGYLTQFIEPNKDRWIG